jgi:hypothetical protein
MAAARHALPACVQGPVTKNPLRAASRQRLGVRRRGASTATRTARRRQGRPDEDAGTQWRAVLAVTSLDRKEECLRCSPPTAAEGETAKMSVGTLPAAVHMCTSHRPSRPNGSAVACCWL